MNMLLRVLLGAIGVFALFGAAQHWFSFDAAFTGRGIAAIDDIGRANLRADVGGLFLGIGAFTLFTAFRQHRGALVATAILLSATLIGRIVSIAFDGFSAPVAPPIIVEAVVLAILGIAYWAWGKKPEGL